MGACVVGNVFFGKGNLKEKVFEIVKNESEHFFRIFKGIGFNARELSRLVELEEQGKYKLIRVTFYKKSGAVWVLESTPTHWFLNAVEYKNPKGIQDWQYILSLGCFQNLKVIKEAAKK